MRCRLSYFSHDYCLCSMCICMVELLLLRWIHKRVRRKFCSLTASTESLTAVCGASACSPRDEISARFKTAEQVAASCGFGAGPLRPRAMKGCSARKGGRERCCAGFIQRFGEICCSASEAGCVVTQPEDGKKWCNLGQPKNRTCASEWESAQRRSVTEDEAKLNKKHIPRPPWR